MSIYGIGKQLTRVCGSEMKNRFAALLGGRDGWLLRRLRASAKHNEIYDERYYEHVEIAMASSAKVISETLVDIYMPKTVVDIGCGSGALLNAFQQKGCMVYGLEYSDAAIGLCKKRGLSVDKFDLESGVRGGKQLYDLCVSTEVAEHIPTHLSARYVKTLCSHSHRCIITAATPGQGGTDHVNEQEHDFWIKLFEENGYYLQGEASKKIRATWRSGNVESWYWKNAMVFEKQL